MSQKSEFNRKSVTDHIRNLSDPDSISHMLLKAIQYNNKDLVQHLFQYKQAESSSIHLTLAAQLSNDLILDMVFDKTTELQRDLSLNGAINSGNSEAMSRLIQRIAPQEDFEVSVLFAEAALNRQKECYFTLCRMGYNAAEALEEIKETLVFGINAKYDMETVEYMHRYHQSYLTLKQEFHLEKEELIKDLKTANCTDIFNQPEGRPEASGIAFLAARAKQFSTLLHEMNSQGRLKEALTPDNYTHKDHYGHSLINILIENNEIKHLFKKEIWNSAQDLENFYQKVIPSEKQHLVDITALSCQLTRQQQLVKNTPAQIHLRRRPK